jgi:hypothetical protein
MSEQNPEVDETQENDHQVEEADKQVNDPDVDTRPAEPVEHTSNVVGRRNEDLVTENLSAPATS